MAEFNEGDEVTVWSGYGNRYPTRLSTVAKIGKRKMTLADGSEWVIGGYRQWGVGKVHSSITVHKRSPDDELKVRRHKAYSAVSSFAAWESLPDDDLFAVAQIVAQYSRSLKAASCPR